MTEPLQNTTATPSDEDAVEERRPERTQHAPAGAPVDLRAALASFDELWSPRIVTRVNDHDVRVARLHGEHLWHTHPDADECFLVLDGELEIALREPTGPRTVRLTRGAVFTVPRGVAHRPAAPHGAEVLLLEPSGTSSVGDHHEEVQAHVDATTGHPLGDVRTP